MLILYRKPTQRLSNVLCQDSVHANVQGSKEQSYRHVADSLNEDVVPKLEVSCTTFDLVSFGDDVEE